MQGTSLLPALEGRDTDLTHTIFATGTRLGDEKYAVIEGNLKLIVNTGETAHKDKLHAWKSPNAQELYDLSTDAREERNLLDTGFEPPIRLQEAVAEFIYMSPSVKKNPPSVKISKRALSRWDTCNDGTSIVQQTGIAAAGCWRNHRVLTVLKRLMHELGEGDMFCFMQQGHIASLRSGNANQ